MTDTELRLECVRIAAEARFGDAALSLANEIYRFVKGEEPKEDMIPCGEGTKADDAFTLRCAGAASK